MAEPTDYVPPKIWTWNKGNGGQFAGINRPTAGPRFDRELPVGKHPFQLYSLGSSNGIQVTIRLAGLPPAGGTSSWLGGRGPVPVYGAGWMSPGDEGAVPAPGPTVMGNEGRRSVERPTDTLPAPRTTARAWA